VEWLKKNRKSFKDLRDKRLAHIDVKLGRDGYQLQEIKGPDWRTLKESVSHLVRIAEILLTILHKKDESFPQAIGIAQKTAADFWDLGADNQAIVATAERFQRCGKELSGKLSG